MKLKTSLVFVSIVIVVAAGYLAWWMMSQASFNAEAFGNRNNGGYIGIALAPEHNTIVSLARFASLPLLLSAAAFIFILISFTSTERFLIVLGIFSALIASYIGIFGFPTELVSSGPIQGQNLVRVPLPLETSGIIARVAAYVITVLSLAVACANVFRIKRNKTTA